MIVRTAFPLRQGMVVTALMGALMLSPSPVFAEARVPVVGADGPTLDACGGVGSVATYEGDLAVHESPDKYARKTDKLPPRTLVWLCEGADDWQGIVYPSGEFQQFGDCRVSSPVAEPRPYAGPCRHGWVSAKDLQLVAG